MIFNPFIKTISALFFPESCCVCKDICHHWICNACQENITLQIQENTHFSPQNISLAHYENDIIKKMLFQYKFHHDQRIGEFLSQKIAQTVKLKEFDMIIPVPNHKKREQQRGFDHIQLLFSQLAMTQHLPYQKLITRKKDTKRLYTLSPLERKNELENAFSINNNARTIIEGKSILIVDDIITTGTTIQAVANTLKPLQPQKISSLTLALAYEKATQTNHQP